MQEEARLPTSRNTKPKPPPFQLSPPKYPTAYADALARIKRQLPIPQRIYWKRLAQLQAFKGRQATRTQQRQQHNTQRLAWQLKLQAESLND